MTIAADAHRAVHLGGKLAEGVIDWSADTQQRSLDLITAKARDAVNRFLDPAYVQTVVTRIEHDAGLPVERPQDTIALVSQQLRFTDDQQDAILSHFIRGGSLTAGGVMHAVTSVAQTLDDADAAHDMESQALKVLSSPLPANPPVHSPAAGRRCCVPRLTPRSGPTPGRFSCPAMAPRPA